MKWTKLIAISIIACCLISWMVVISETDIKSFDQVSFERIDNETVQPVEVLTCGKLIEKLLAAGDQVFAKPLDETAVYAVGPAGLRMISNMEHSKNGLIIQWGVGNNFYYQADVRSRKLTERKGKAVSEFTVSTPFTRIIRLDNGNYLVKRFSGKGNADDYYVYKKNTEPDLHFGNLLIDRNDGGFANDGFFISNNHGTY